MKKRMDRPFRVFVGLVPTGYLDSKLIEQTIRDGMVFCGTKSFLEHGQGEPVRRVLIRPSIIRAHDKTAANLYTHPEIVRPTIAEILASVPRAQVTVAESSASAYSTARMLRRAKGNSDNFRRKGYYELEHLFPGKVTVTPLEDTPQARYELSKGSVLSSADQHTVLESCGNPGTTADIRELSRRRFHNEILASRLFKDSGFTVYCPKIKIDLSSDGFSGALRMGAAHDNWSLFSDYNICDALEVCFPQLIVSDAIVVPVGGHRLRQSSQELGAILVSNNAVAHDWVAARILNSDAAKIAHLRMACERGWGPSSFSQIEIGGAGTEGVQQLAQKTQIWDMAYPRLNGFAEHFSAENNAVPFPLEIISSEPYEPAAAHGLVLDWLYQNYETPNTRSRMSTWPKATICIGKTNKLPAHSVVYAIGDSAVRSIRELTSTSTTLLSLRGVELCTVQLKNERRHLVVNVVGNPPRPQAIRRAFAIGSAWRMRASLSRLSRFLDKLVNWVTERWRASHPNAQTHEVVLTSRLRHNKWWSLTPTATLIAEAEKAAAELR